MSDQERRADLLRVEMRTILHLFRDGLLPADGPTGYSPVDVGRAVARASEKAVRAPRSQR